MNLRKSGYEIEVKGEDVSRLEENAGIRTMQLRRSDVDFQRRR